MSLAGSSRQDGRRRWSGGCGRRWICLHRGHRWRKRRWRRCGVLSYMDGLICIDHTTAVNKLIGEADPSTTDALLERVRDREAPGPSCTYFWNNNTCGVVVTYCLVLGFNTCRCVPAVAWLAYRACGRAHSCFFLPPPPPLPPARFFACDGASRLPPSHERAVHPHASSTTRADSRSTTEGVSGYAKHYWFFCCLRRPPPCFRRKSHCCFIWSK